MTPTYVARNEKEHIVTTPIIVVYNGGGSANHELIATSTPPYEHTSWPFYLYKDVDFR